MPNSTLIIFDYDWSLVDENSDIYIFKVLCPQLLDTIELRRKDSPSWTRLIDELLGELSTLRPHLSLSELKEVLAKIPVQDGMLEAVAHALQKNAIIKIISDANTFYIRSFLDHHGLSTHISEIFTNHAYFDENNRLRVSPYHSLDYEPHGCSFCPANMCKGRILDTITNKCSFRRVIYVGDGNGDFCPSMRLRHNDIVLARKDSTRSYGLLEQIRKYSDKVAATVIEWSTGRDIQDLFTSLIDDAA